MIVWILYMIALSLLITGAALACSQICSLFRIPTRWCWVAALLCSIAAPLVARSVPVGVQGNALRVTAATYRVIQTVSEASPLPATATTSSVTAATQNSIIMVAWAIASGALLLVLAVASTRLRIARRAWSGKIVCGERVLVSANTGPAVVGLLHHEIVLPAWVLELDDAEIALAVTHEREHVLAHDPWLLLTALLVVALAPWNPALWFQLRRLRRSVEGDCDARVLDRTRDARRYAALLIAVGERRNNARVPVLALSYPTSILEWRIRTMIDRTPSHRTARAIVCVAVVAVLAVGIGLLPRPGMSQRYQPLRAFLPASARSDTDTVSKASRASRDSALTLRAMTRAAKRDTLNRLRRELAQGTLAERSFTVTLNPKTHRASPPVSNAEMQAAVARRFPDVAVVPGSNRVFAFVVRPNGDIEDALMDSTFAGAPSSALSKLHVAPDSVDWIVMNKKVPVGKSVASVIWIALKQN